ncbi:hypothetical protein SEA_LUCKYSOCKE_79 [Streptomyces phage LuckySocke]|jgi:hypothetical protein|nr:hypothetical protein SEA_ALONE_81 [Streptomyces phage Alone3]WPH58989.1 hypothetical protein SEA_LUCKYSOCKE_79 [Streptomyces phage LuckySocke]
MATARKRSGDFTGQQTEKLQAEHAETLKQRAQEISLMAEVEAEENAKPVDYTKGPTPRPEQDLEVAEEVELREPTRTIIPNTNLESVTFGAGNHYTFEEGRKYVVPRELADHLSSKGLLWEARY